MKIWQRKLALALVLVMVFMCATPAFAVIPDDILDEVRVNGKWGTDLITHSIIDLVYVLEGSVTTYTYKGSAEELTVNKFTVTPKAQRQQVKK